VTERSGEWTPPGVWGSAGALPPELNRAVPRPVRLTLLGKVVAAAAILSALEAFVFGTWLSETARRSQQEAAEARRAAVKTMARVSAISRSGKQAPRVHYRFEVEGKPYAGSFSLAGGSRARYTVGQPLEIAYLPGRPERNWPTGREPRGIPTFLGPLAAAVSLAVAAALGLYLRSQRRLLEEGRVAIATVVRVEAVRLKSVRYRVRYEFPLLSGARQTGRFDLARDPAPAPGTPMVVIYDPVNPRRQRRYPFPLVRVAPD
jgi:hypothetical protein